MNQNRTVLALTQKYDSFINFLLFWPAAKKVDIIIQEL